MRTDNWSVRGRGEELKQYCICLDLHHKFCQKFCSSKWASSLQIAPPGGVSAASDLESHFHFTLNGFTLNKAVCPCVTVLYMSSWHVTLHKAISRMLIALYHNVVRCLHYYAIKGGIKETARPSERKKKWIGGKVLLLIDIGLVIHKIQFIIRSTSYMIWPWHRPRLYWLLDATSLFHRHSHRS